MEVGRDWDSSWGIIEPSSMRSIIQFAGRIQRHRRVVPENENLVILSSNIKALRKRSPAFCKPGFENKDHPLASHDLRELLPPQDYQTITALPRILPANGENKLAELEHMRLREELLSSKSRQIIAANWWRKPLTWNAWLQRKTPFRQSQPEARFFLHMEEEESEPYFAFHTENGNIKASDKFVLQDVEYAEGTDHWGCTDYRQVLLALADAQQTEINRVGEIFGEISVPVNEEDVTSDWRYHPWLGVYRDIN